MCLALLRLTRVLSACGGCSREGASPGSPAAEGSTAQTARSGHPPVGKAGTCSHLLSQQQKIGQHNKHSNIIIKTSMHMS